MMKETLSGTILLINFHLTLSTRQHQILLLCLILYFSERKEENADIAEITEAEVPAPAPAPTLENSQKTTTYSKNKEVNKELWEASQHT